ncbi:MAG: DUF4381 domain-containing protein [Nibricoccus sp.]
MSADPTSLDSLHDIIVPAAAPWWPPAPGWWWLVALVLWVFIVGGLRWLRHYRRNRYRREALVELGRCEPLLRDPAQRVAGVASIGVVLKRAALSAWPREKVAALTGPAWLAFLDRSNGSQHGKFINGPGHWLEIAAFDPTKATGLDEPAARELATLARSWITHHRPEAPSC